MQLTSRISNVLLLQIHIKADLGKQYQGNTMNQFHKVTTQERNRKELLQAVTHLKW